MQSHLDRRARSSAAAAILALVPLASVAPAQSYKLNGPLATPVTGSLRDVQTTTDGARAVYLADQQTHGVFELFAVPTDGSLASVRLSGPLAADGNVKFFALAADGGRVVFTADHATNGVFELFSAPVDGSGPRVRLNGPLVPGGSVGRDSDLAPPFQLSPDGARVVYRADQQTDEVYELYSVPLGGGEPVRLNDPLGVAADVAANFRIGADGLRVVYLVYPAPAGGGELFSVPVDRSAPPVSLNGPLPAGRYTEQFEITPDASRVVYRADQEVDNRLELFSVPISGAAPPTKLATPTNPSGFEAFVLSPDSSRALYTEVEGPPWSRHLESVPVDGSAPPVRLSGAFAFFGRIEISSDSSRVVYSAARDFEISRYELFSVPLDRRTGGLRLHAVGDSASVYGFRISPDSRTVVFHTQRYPDSRVDLLSVAIDGGSLPRVRRLGWSPHVVHLNDPFVPSGYPELDWNYGISADSTTVFYRAREVPDEWSSLYRVPIGGGASSVRLNGPTRDESVTAFQLAPDGRIFLRDREDNPFGFHPTCMKAVASDGSAPAVRLTPVLANSGVAGDVFAFATSAEGAWTVYLANQEVYEATELFGVPTDGSLAPVKLNADYPQADLPSGISGATISPDGGRVAFVTEYSTSPRGEELSSAPVDGSAPAVMLSGPVPPGANVHSFRFGPESQHVFFVLDQDVDEVHQLFRAPAAGGAPAIRLNAPLVAGGDVWSDFEIAPDGAHVVYVADQTTNDVFELFVVPSDASAAPVRLSGTLVAGGDVGSSNVGYEISPDGAWVVYGADQRTNDVVELFAVPLDGSTAAVALNGPLVAAGDVRAFRIDPTSARVVYQADEDADEVIELFSAPIDGSAAAVKLNGSLVVGGDVFLPTTFGFPASFLIAPDGQRVVYVADQATDEQFELFSVPIDGSQAAARLNRPLAPAGDVAVFPQGSPIYPPIFRAPQIAPDGACVVYVATEEREVVDLFSVPIDGGQPSVRVSALSPAGVVAFAVHPDATRVVYETSGAELLVAPIDGSQAPVALASSLTPDLGFGPVFRISPDGSRVLYRAEPDAPSVTELYGIELP